MAYKHKALESYPLINCLVCKQETRARKASKKYCSNACRQAAAHKRHDEKLGAKVSPVK